MSFIQAPFWAQDASYTSTPHATSVLVTPAVLTVLTLAQVKLRASLTWPDGDARDELAMSYLAAATRKVEVDSGLALLTQTRDVYLDAIRSTILQLPAQSRPLQSVTSITSTDTAGAVNILSPSQYVVDLAGARVGLALGGSWPTDLRPFQPYVLRIVAGWVSADLLMAAEPLLVHLVGRLAAHYATVGGDLASLQSVNTVPFGYDDDIAAYRPVSVA